MTIHAEILPDAASGNAASYGYACEPGRTRHDGWTADRQRIFLQALSEGAGVTHACRVVGMSQQSAYALRRSARGAGFALGWQAAQLLGREVLADDLLERAMNGVTETFTYRNGDTAERHRHDNRLAMAMLSRMDRMADAARHEASHAAARLVAREFDQYLDLIGKDAGPARAGLFLGARAEAASDDDLAPIRALARADRWLRTHVDLAEPLATADLDPGQRADWSAEQWARAEAAGLVQLAPPAPEPAPEPDSRDGIPQLHQLCGEQEPVWWDEGEEKWRTRFPPPEGFYGEQDGDYGDSGYSRELTNDEEEEIEAPHRREVAARRVVEDAERDRFFAVAGAADSPTEALPAAAAAPAAAASAKRRNAPAPG